MQAQAGDPEGMPLGMLAGMSGQRHDRRRTWHAAPWNLSAPAMGRLPAASSLGMPALDASRPIGVRSRADPHARTALAGVRSAAARPLLLHLTLAMLRSSVSLAGSMNWKPVSPNWNPRQTGRAIEAEAAFLAGIRAWRAHPWHRDLPDPPVRWREATARLLDYGGDGPVVLFVPSLVNRWTVLDLMPGHSMLRWLAEQGVHPMLLDWGEPEPAFTLTDYIAGRLVRAMAGRRMRDSGDRIVLAGYCMGGTFATAAAALRPDLVSGLALLAAPWDFHAGDVEHLHKLTATCAMLEPLLRDAETVPVDCCRPCSRWTIRPRSPKNSASSADWIRTAPPPACSSRWRTG